VRRTAAVLWGTCLALAAAGLGLLAAGAGGPAPEDSSFAGLDGVAYVGTALVFATVGVLVARRVPRNPIGWLLLGAGVLYAAGDTAFQYADQALLRGHDWPGARVAVLAIGFAEAPVVGLLALTLLLFPDGRLPSRRWTPVLVLAVGGLALFLTSVVRPGPLEAPFDGEENPLGIPGTRGVLLTVSALGWFAMVAALACSAFALRHRLRHAHGVERLQLRVMALGAGTTAAAFVLGLAVFIATGSGSGAVQAVTLSVFPVSAGVAILRHRLYDIDVVVNRALVYGTLTATLAATYAGTVLLTQLVLDPVTGDSGLAVAASTLAVAALFRPARARIQETVDRRFYRRRHDARRTLEAFGARLRDEVSLDALSAELREVVDETMQPAHVGLWLRAPDD
jgi:hypothetical protein